MTDTLPRAALPRTALSGAALPRTVHMLGICGTAMTALAGVLQARGVRVSGSDSQAYPPMSDHLRALEIPFRLGYAAQNIPAETELVVVGNVIRRDNPEAAAMRERQLPHLSMAEAVKRYAIGERHTIAAVGTHGKTTTTALAAHLLVDLGADPGFLVGGIAHNFGANFRLGSAPHFVIEGDEYDTAYFDKTPKFFKYEPATLLFTSLEFDHADIYADLEAIRTQFAALLEGMPADGLVIACADDANVAALLPRAPCPVVSYGFSEGADFRLSDWADAGEAVGGTGTGAVSDTAAGSVRFHSTGQGADRTWYSPMAGRHNALNAAAVLVLGRRLGYPDQSLQQALSRFEGVRRRQEVRGIADGVTVVDDFAHHPTAVATTIEAMQARYAGRRLWAVFEPRSYTARGRTFQAEFAAALSRAGRVLLARPFSSDYSAGVELMDTAAVARQLEADGIWAQALDSTDALLDCLQRETAPGDVVLIMSNGGFDDIHTRLLDALHKRSGRRDTDTPPGATPA